MNNVQIVASMLIRNEDIYIEKVIRNIVDFCDKIIVTDHQSKDQTFEICQRLAAEFSKIELHIIHALGESSQVLRPFYGTNTWVFAVDGDEIFDPAGLQEMRSKLLAGEFSESWNIFANTLHCTQLDLKTQKAWGYLAPPARAGARLYNFSIIDDWQDYGERLLGSNIIFKEGYHLGLRRYLHTELDWDTSYFRYIHTSFLPRSSMDKHALVNTRLNADEVGKINNQTNPILKLHRWLKTHFSHFMGKDWKNQKYRQGPLVEKDASPFFYNRTLRKRNTKSEST
ncbi:MAG TPA: glycosyltransferase family 2 protein [Anaerolineales bacterium]|nr:glycosyltransferase family 2 protein [Anaerolineales bacterium]